MITDRIGRHEVPLPINRIYSKIREGIKRKTFQEKKYRENILKLLSSSAHAMVRTVQFLRHDAYTVQLHCLIRAKIVAGDSQSDARIVL